jgi:acetyl esterase/lipase
MRETRLSGLAGGAAQLNAPLLPQSVAAGGSPAVFRHGQRDVGRYCGGRRLAGHFHNEFRTPSAIASRPYSAAAGLPGRSIPQSFARHHLLPAMIFSRGFLFRGFSEPLRISAPVIAILCLAAPPAAQADFFDDLKKKVGDVEAKAKKALESLVPEIEPDVCYGEVDGQKLLLDIWRPAGHDPTADKPRPAVVIVHGGAWAHGSKSENLYRAAAFLLSREKFIVFNIDYRLVQRGRNGDPSTNAFPAALDDCQRAVRWVRANAQKYGVDARSIGALGASAGGHLVALLGSLETRENSDPELARYSSRVTAVVDIFGPADLTRDFSHLPLGDGTVQTVVDDFVGTGASSHAREASPLFCIGEHTAPTLIFHGDQDALVPVEQSRDYHAALQRAGRECVYVEFAGEGHGFKNPKSIERFNRETVAFFKKHLAPPRKKKDERPGEREKPQ